MRAWSKTLIFSAHTESCASSTTRSKPLHSAINTGSVLLSVGLPTLPWLVNHAPLDDLATSSIPVKATFPLRSRLLPRPGSLIVAAPQAPQASATP